MTGNDRRNRPEQREHDMVRIIPRPGIAELEPYTAGASPVAGLANAEKLSSNENPLGPSPKAIEAIGACAATAHRYPSPDHTGLREAIAGIHQLDPARIVCGAGSDEIIALLCRAYVGPGDETVHTEHGFSMYRISTLASGATPRAVPERERVADVDAILAECGERTRLVFLANPNNPTGTMIGQADLARLADGLPPRALLVLDGAYAEYVDGYDAGAALVETRSNVVMTRTFSKIHGLAALRVGWAYGPVAVVETLNRVRGPFNVSAPALAAAEAAIRDTAYTEYCRGENARLRGWLADALAEVGVPSDTSCGNFILARFHDRAAAVAVDGFLRSRGLIVRRMEDYGLPQGLRITVGDEGACGRVAEALRAFKGTVA